MGARWEFAGGIEKLVGNIPRDRQRKTVRLAARMSETAGLTGGPRGSLMRNYSLGPRYMELSLEDKADLKRADDGPRLSLSIRLGSDNVVGLRREFAKRFAEGIGKVAGNTPRDHRKKTERLTSRMPEAVGLAGMRSWFSLLVIKSCNH
ncbi:hypothetical protein B296_00010128 [Ensete ventricosum]|uniref:Uncharacterized protein n=1 Tax=Ensete ventricosum TaxID=4639 RepID=A0A426Z243_ENSVE|nr:hypothetical protein B296_00010128 [Ensete ventricosum]